MSLTSEIRCPDSAVRQFLLEMFPNMRVVAREIRARMRESDTVRPPIQARYPYSTIGHAVDYRIRYYLAITPIEDLVAYRAAIG